MSLSRPSNLPIQRDPLVGRSEELASIKDLLRRPDVGLVTLTGTGGTGKTRLGLQLAAELLDEFADGVWFVDLAPIRDPALVVSAVATTLRIQERDGQSLIASLQASLRHKQILLVLDNFEQVLTAASTVVELLAAAAGLKVVVTSRERLHLRGEHEVMVHPLALPDIYHLPSAEQLVQYPAVALFVRRAQEVSPGFAVTATNAAVVAEICVRLDGLPLAIELAAARIKLLAPERLLARLAERLKILTGGPRDAPARHQTLRNTADWSYNLMEAYEQQLFRRVAIFSGNWTLEAAEAVCNASNELPDILDLLQSLLDKSLVRPAKASPITPDADSKLQPASEPRYVVLETLREYALDRLMASGEAERLARQHAAYFLALAERAEQELLGDQQIAGLDQIEADHDNLRAALTFFTSTQDDVESAFRLAGALWRFWERRGYFSEGRRWLEAVIAMPDQAGSSASASALRAKVLEGAGKLARDQRDYPRARAFHQESIMLWRALGDQRGQARALANLGVVMHDQGDYSAARALYEESQALWRGTGDRWGLARALTHLGIVLHEQGDYTAGRRLLEESLLLLREIDDQVGIAMALNNLGFAAIQWGVDSEAVTYLEESLERYRLLRDRAGIASTLSSLGSLALSRHDYEQAQRCYTEGLQLGQQLDDQAGIAECLEGLADVGAAYRTSEHAMWAVQLWSAAARLRERVGVPLPGRDRAQLERRLAPLHGRLDDAAFAEAWNAGHALSLPAAIATALAPPDMSQVDLAQIAAPDVAPDDLADLTSREIDVLRLIARALSDKQIAERLIISPRTVQTHLASIYSKLGVNSRTAAASWATEHNLI